MIGTLAQKQIRRKSAKVGEVDMKEAAKRSEALEVEAGDEEGLIRRYDRLIGYFARRFRFDTDDMIQIGRMELLHSFRTWQDKPHNSLFWTYARKAVIGAMMNYATREASRLAKEGEAAVPVSGFNPPDAQLELREHLSVLSDRERSILGMFVEGCTPEEISTSHGISRPRVYQLLDGAMESIRGHA